ncbi:hypothetical protein HMPREF9455_00603 [Dysgonomonas gadei ATCC BAA-286]|uniref:Uncharacterized protein n=1 Tax=Dysgonomonas gadei ATCC BAA-286 TaxID=742766 RepID=F5IU36_9BACT|nr:hypothetical protein HMPREF9455_00603 [Dysgonomonas gadei ATCC BAA-286]
MPKPKRISHWGIWNKYSSSICKVVTVGLKSKTPITNVNQNIRLIYKFFIYLLESNTRYAINRKEKVTIKFSTNTKLYIPPLSSICISNKRCMNAHRILMIINSLFILLVSI